MIRTLLLWLAPFCLALCGVAAAAPHRTLTIGVSSFPSTLNPEIDADLIKFYDLGCARSCPPSPTAAPSWKATAWR